VECEGEEEHQNGELPLDCGLEPAIRQIPGRKRGAVQATVLAEDKAENPSDDKQRSEATHILPVPQPPPENAYPLRHR